MTEQKTIAVVHWHDGGVEKKARAYTLQMLSQLIETMNKRGFTYYVCLTQLDTIVPVRSQSPFKTDSTPDEYIGGGRRTKNATQGICGCCAD